MPLNFSSPLPPLNILSIDMVDEFGAKADNITDNSPIIEAAYQELVKRLNGAYPDTIGQLYFKKTPDKSAYRIGRPIVVEHDRIGLAGEDETVTINNNLGYNGPAVVLGVRTIENNSNGQSLQSSSLYRPDIYGKLDGSIITGPGQRYGFRTRADSCLVFQGCPGDRGYVENPIENSYAMSYAAINSGFVLEIAIEHSGGTKFFGETTAGIVKLGYQDQTVFKLDRGGSDNLFTLTMYLSDGTYCQSSVQASASTSGTIGLCFQVDLINREVIGFINGTQTAVNSGGTFFSGSGQTSMIANTYHSLIFGVGENDSDGTRVPVATYNTTGMDFTICGFSLSAQKCYKNLGVGQTQTRIDNGTVNDNYRYFGFDNTNRRKFFLLNMQDNPSDPNTKRFFRASSLVFAGTYYGLHIQNSMFTALAGLKNNFIKKLRITAHPNQPALLIGGVLDFKLDRVILENCSQCVSIINMIANYTHRYTDCTFSANDVAVQGSWSVIDIFDTQFFSVVHSCIRVFACNTNIYNIGWMFGTVLSDSIFQSYGGPYGGLHHVEKVLVDFEGLPYRVAPFLLEQHSAFISPATSYKIKDVYTGTTGDKCPIFKVRQKYSNDGINFVYLDVDNIQTTNADYTAILDLNGNAIVGKISNVYPDIGNPIIHRGEFGSECNIQIEHRGYQTVPRQGNWVENGHRIYPQSLTEGEFGIIECLKTGKFGTANPPVFFGDKQRRNSPLVIGAYVVPHAYINLTIGGVQ